MVKVESTPRSWLLLHDRRRRKSALCPCSSGRSPLRRPGKRREWTLLRAWHACLWVGRTKLTASTFAIHCIQTWNSTAEHSRIMPPFLYSPPATSLLSYSDICLDPSSSYAVVLSDATEARARLRDALKQAQGNDADWLAVLDVRRRSERQTRPADDAHAKAAQGYLRHVFGLQDLLDADKVLQKGELGKHAIADPMSSSLLLAKPFRGSLHSRKIRSDPARASGRFRHSLQSSSLLCTPTL